MSDKRDTKTLTEIQLQILIRLNEGMRQRDIADAVGRSESAIHKSVRSIKDHYGVDSLVEVLRKFRRERPEHRPADPDAFIPLSPAQTDDAVKLLNRAALGGAAQSIVAALMAFGLMRLLQHWYGPDGAHFQFELFDLTWRVNLFVMFIAGAAVTFSGPIFYLWLFPRPWLKAARLAWVHVEDFRENTNRTAYTSAALVYVVSIGLGLQYAFIDALGAVLSIGEMLALAIGLAVFGLIPAVVVNHVLTFRPKELIIFDTIYWLIAAILIGTTQVLLT